MASAGAAAAAAPENSGVPLRTGGGSPPQHEGQLTTRGLKSLSHARVQGTQEDGDAVAPQDVRRTAKLLATVTMLHSKGLLNQRERLLLKELIVTANEHILAELLASESVYDRALEESGTMSVDFVASCSPQEELCDTLRTMLQMSHML